MGKNVNVFKKSKESFITPQFKVLMVTDYLFNRVGAGCQTAGGADIVFVLDGSGSIGSTNFEKCKTFVRSLVEEFEIGLDRYRIGVQQYSSCK